MSKPIVKRPVGRPPKEPIPAEAAQSLALAAASGDKGLIERTIVNEMMGRTSHNVVVTPEEIEVVIAMIAGGSSMKAACELLGIEQTIVRWRCTHDRDLADRVSIARRLGAEVNHETMIEVAMNPEIEVSRARLITDVLREIARVHNKAFDQRVQVDHNAVVINVDMGSARLT